MPEPLVTIGLPVYNAGTLLQETLRSIFAQTLADWELLAFDDGSTDGSAEILKSLRDPRVRVFSERENRGLAARLNFIHANARGRYIARMDADDLMHPERLAQQVAFLESQPEVDVVGCGIVVLGRDLKPRGLRSFPAAHDQVMQGPVLKPQLCHATVMARAEWWQRYRYNEENRGCEDLELWLAAHRDSRFANLPALLYYYCEYASFSLPKYLRSRAHVASLAWRVHGHGRLRAAAEIAGHFARGGIYLAVGALGMQDKLIARRSSPLTKPQYEECVAAIERIRATPIA